MPFAIGKENAMSAVSALIRETEKLAGIEKLEIYVNNALHTAYLPFSLVDISCQVDAGLLGGRYYQEYLNWACPESVLFDVGVIDRLDPWDFFTETAFDPAFMDGNTRIAGMFNMASRIHMIDFLIQRRITEDFEKISGKSMNIRQWVHDYRPHNANVLLPVFWADMKELCGRYVCAAVNGQTGKAVVQVLGTKEKENYIVEGFPVFWKEFSQDSTMINIPVKIKPVGSSMKWVKPV